MDVGDIHSFHSFLKAEFDRLHSYAKSYQAENDDEEGPQDISTAVSKDTVTSTVYAFQEKLSPLYKKEVQIVTKRYFTNLRQKRTLQEHLGKELQNTLSGEDMKLFESLKIHFENQQKFAKELDALEEEIKKNGFSNVFRQSPNILKDLKEEIDKIPSKRKKEIVETSKSAKDSLITLLTTAIFMIKGGVIGVVFVAAMILMCSILYGMLTQNPVKVVGANLGLAARGEFPVKSSDVLKDWGFSPLAPLVDAGETIVDMGRAATWDHRTGFFTSKLPKSMTEVTIKNPVEDNKAFKNFTNALSVETKILFGVGKEDLDFQNKLPLNAKGIFDSLQEYRKVIAKVEEHRAKTKLAAETTRTIREVGMDVLLDGFVDLAWDVMDAPKAAGKIATKGLLKGVKKTGEYVMSALVKKKVSIAKDIATAGIGYATEVTATKINNQYATRMNVGIVLIIDRWIAAFIVGCLLKATAWIATIEEYRNFASLLNATSKALFYYNAANILAMSFALSAAEVGANAGATFLTDFTGLQFWSSLAPGQSMALFTLNVITGTLTVSDAFRTSTGVVGDCLKLLWSARPTNMDEVQKIKQNLPKEGDESKKTKTGLKHGYAKRKMTELMTDITTSLKSDKMPSFSNQLPFMRVDAVEFGSLKF